ncbi:hypothetical protein [Sporosarcina sp. ITBMC105]
MEIEILELYYKKYTDTVEASDYIEWAKNHIYMDIIEMKKLASMREPLNFFEIEEMFANTMKVMKRKAPSEKECVNYHLKNLHSQLLIPIKNAKSIVKEIYRCTIKHDLFEEQMNWREISNVINNYQDGDKQHGYTEEKINEMIITLARRLWHTKISNVTFHDMIGEKVTAIDSEVHFIIQLGKGAIIIECPWRIRDTSGILLGETDIQSNHKEWKSIEELLVGKTIKDIQLLEQCPLLILQFDNIFVDLFHASSFFDGWTLTDGSEFYMFSMHGGDIA